MGLGLILAGIERIAVQDYDQAAKKCEKKVCPLLAKDRTKEHHVPAVPSWQEAWHARN